MDFTCPSTFPDFKMHIALFPLTSPDSSTDDIARRKAKLKELVKAYPDELTLINTRYVASLMHISIAVSRSFLNKSAGKHAMKTANLGNEVLYHLYPTHSVKIPPLIFR